MSPRSRRLWIGLALVVFFFLRDDFWLAHDSSLVFGLPVGLAYHAGYCLAASLLMAALVAFSRPARARQGPHADGDSR